jgi:molecular chaperone GrpE
MVQENTDNHELNPAADGVAGEVPGAAGEQTDAATAAEGATPALSPEAAEIERLRAELAAAQAKADDYLDKLQRTAADFQNSRRRLENQMADEIERANSGLIKRLLPVLDDLDLAFQNVPEELRDAAAENGNASQQAWVQGFAQIRKKLLDTLAEYGVMPVDTSAAFDPNLHEAISSEPSETVASGHIIAQVRAGYEYKGRVLRPALVRVAM